MSLSIPSSGVFQRYLKPLLEGDRIQCRKVIEEAMFEGATAFDLLTELLWPAMEMIQSHHREDRINQNTLNLATRLNRIDYGSGFKPIGAEAVQWAKGADFLRRG